VIASLPMYDWPETKNYNDQFWTILSSTLVPTYQAVPKALTRSDIRMQWQSDAMLLSQTCVYPLVTELPASTVVVATPTYHVDRCENGHYASVLLVRESDTRTQLDAFAESTLAYNSTDSQSGFNALKSLLVEEQLINDENPVFFSKAIQTGSHRASIKAVAHAEAAICAIDPVSWALAQRYDSEAKRVRVLTETAYAPALPLVSSAAAIPVSMNEAEWRTLVMAAFEQAIDSDPAQQLLLNGITFIPKTDYLALPISNLDMITL